MTTVRRQSREKQALKIFPTLLLLVITLCALPCQSQTETVQSENHSPHFRDVKSIVRDATESFMKNGQTIGISIGIVQDGKKYFYNSGTMERGTDHTPDVHTRYFIASITKTVTGALLAQAVTEKKVHLDDDVRQYLEGEYPNLEYNGQPIRLWQLINHTSGLPRNLPEDIDTLIGTGGDITQQSVRQAEIMEKYTKADFYRDLHHASLTRMPGEKFSYSNAAAQLLGLVLERVYGKSYEELIRDKIAGPLKMRDTTVTLTPTVMAHLPRGYSGSNAFLPAVSTRFPAAGSLISSTEDMLKYLSWHLAETDEAVKLTHLPAGNTVWSADNSFTVGLNWQMLKTSGGRNIFQDGNIPGFHSMCVICPELKMGIIVLTNEEVRERPAQLSPLINQILTGIEPRYTATP